MSANGEEKENELIRALKEQVHKSFLQINEMQRLFHMQLEHTKRELEQRQLQLKTREEEIKTKYQALESKLKADNAFTLDIGKIDDSGFLLEDEISIVKDNNANNTSFRDSSILGLHRMLDSADKPHTPQNKLETLKQLQKSVLVSISSPPPQALLTLFAMTSQFCLENCRLREQHANCADTTSIYKTRQEDMILQLKRLQTEEIKLKSDNENLTKLYWEALASNDILVERIAKLEEELKKKVREVKDLEEALKSNGGSGGYATTRPRCLSNNILDDELLSEVNNTHSNLNQPSRAALDQTKMSTVSNILSRLERTNVVSHSNNNNNLNYNNPPVVQNNKTLSTRATSKSGTSVGKQNVQQAPTTTIFKKKQKKVQK